MSQKITETHKPILSFLEKRDKAIDASVSLYLCSIIDKSKNVTSPEVVNINIDLLKKIKLNFFMETLLIVINFVCKFFNKNFKKIDRLLSKNSVANFLINKHIEIFKPSLHAPSTSLTFEKLHKNSYLSPGIQLGLYELQKLQHNLYKTELQRLDQSIKNPNLSTKERQDVFASLPRPLQKEILSKAAQAGFSNRAIKANLSLLLEKNDSKKSILQDLIAYHKNQLTLCNNNIQRITDQFLENPQNVTTDNYSFNTSSDRLTDTIRSHFLKKPISVVMAGIEYAGLIKEGGLAEALEGLSKGLKQQHKDNKVTLVFPKLNIMPTAILNSLKTPQLFKTPNGIEYKVYTYLKEGIEFKFIEHPSINIPEGHSSVYGPSGDSQSERFASFSELAADFIYSGLKPDIIHLHDWHVAGIALKLKKDHEQEWLQGKLPPVVFTYHNNNRASQGRVDFGVYTYGVGNKAYTQHGITEGSENLFLKTLEIADMTTTVSETFANESQDLEYGHGISFAVREIAKAGKLVGIINGVNPERWNPETDVSLKNWQDLESHEPIDLSYSPNHPDIVSQRDLAKNQLEKWVRKYSQTEVYPKKVDLDFSKPFVTYIGRFDSSQKGLDKFEEAIESTLKNGGQFICMGTGEDDVAKEILDNLEKKYTKGVLFIRDRKDPDHDYRLFFQQGNQERPGIGSLIRACSDFIFIPSSFEPCGLVQFEGGLYGSLAIGSKTGGLVDTIIPKEKNAETFNGFLFSRKATDPQDPDTCANRVKTALEFWISTDKATKNKMLQRIIEAWRKSGWTTSSKQFTPVDQYRFVYEQAKKIARHRKTINNIQQLLLKNNSDT
ncbi:MAG: glycogen/starch synthase, partial [Chlamydiota bacterium]